MTAFLTGGARFALPFLFFFFSFFPAMAGATTAGLYEVFYRPLPAATKWLKTAASDPATALFAARYHLPVGPTGRYVHRLAISSVPSYATDQEYIPLYLELPRSTAFSLLIGGAKKGTIQVNGEKKGEFKLADPADHVEVTVTLEPGVYALLFVVEERFAGIPLTILSDRPLSSAKRGFTQKFSATVKVSPRRGEEGLLFARLYDLFCFPAPNDDETTRAAERLWREMPSEDASISELPLIALLLHASHHRPAHAALRAAGFSDEDLRWWAHRFSEKKGRCHDGTAE